MPPNNNKKIFYVVNARMPTERAHGVQIAKMCEAFALAHFNFELVLPRMRNEIKENLFDYYDIKTKFKITKLPVIDFLTDRGRFAFLIESITFYISLFFYFMFKKGDYVVYTRGEIILPLAKFLRKPFFWETHIKPKNFNRYQKAINKSSGLVAVTNYYKNELIELGINKEKILYVPDGVDLAKFDLQVGREEARKKLGLPMDKKIVLYSGHLYEWKGVDVLIESSKLMGESVDVYLVGGDTKELQKIGDYVSENKYDNIKIVGHKPYSEIPFWLKASDVLVLPNTAKSEVSKFYTSPMKLFEYMASGRPIVASRLPSFEDVLNNENSFLVIPDNSEILAKKVNFILENPEVANGVAQKAHIDSRNYSWEKRVGKILEFMNN
jgi:glycosyltransferase involved in cell wall biosynthesis